MLPWSLRWQVWFWGKVWIYEKLWGDHKFIVFLACLGLAFLLYLMMGLRR